MMNQLDESTTCSTEERQPPYQKKDEAMKKQEQSEILNQRLSHIKHKIMVLSGKGGVGKSTVAVNLALALSNSGKRTGLLDIDIHGPSVPKMLNLNGTKVYGGSKTIRPVDYDTNLKVMSIGLLLEDRDQALIWRGPRKFGVIRQFLADVEWGDLEYLIIDSPPGTGDEPLTIAQLIPKADGAIVVTTPQELAIEDVRKSIQFCRTVSLPVIGVIENMSSFICPNCKHVYDIFGSGGGQKMAQEMGVPFLGKIPIHPAIMTAGETGHPIISGVVDSEVVGVFQAVIEPLLKL
jgi:Mrp family chromosome partitioning ATPase